MARGLRAIGSMLTEYLMPRSCIWASDRPTVAISGSVKMFDDTPAQRQRRDGVAERVRHRQPPLHGRDRRERQDPVTSPAA